MKLYFVRHGQSEANTRHIISNRLSPFGLTPLGKEQAIALAKSLMGVPVTGMYSSPICRARETAEILAASFDLTYQVTEALREYDCGALEDKSDEASWKLHREIAEDWVWNHNHSRKPEGGESFLEIRNRFIPFVEDLLREAADQDENVLLVGHGGLFHLMLPLLLKNVDDVFVQSHGMGHTECVIAEARAGELVCVQWGLVHLEEG
jgi:probable phosphoglycerate mutase